MPAIPARWRKWIYGVSIATVPVLVAFGVLEESKVASILAMLNAIFIGGLAIANVPKADA